MREADKSQKASYDQVLEVRQTHFYHIRLVKKVINQPRLRGTEGQLLLALGYDLHSQGEKELMVAILERSYQTFESTR